MNTLDFVSHRGLMQEYPENSLLAFAKSIEAGSLFLECDVHLSRDMQPVVLHDASLERTCNTPGIVFDFDASELQSISAGYPAKFADRFLAERIPRLSELVTLIEKWPAVQLFVELKRRSLYHHGREVMLDKVLEVLQSIEDRIIIISFDYDVMAMARKKVGLKVGWVIEQWDEETKNKASILAPDYLFADYEKMPQKDALWPGPWRWVIYDVTDYQIAAQLVSQGAMVESQDVKSLIQQSGDLS